jgi:RHS repeat-associated protein
MNAERKWRKQKLLMRILGWKRRILYQRVVFPAFLPSSIFLRMEKVYCALLLLLSIFVGNCQQVGGDVGNSEQISPSTPSIVEQDGNSQVWQWITYDADPSGNFVTNTHSYTELATGLNYLSNGQWVASSEDIDILPNGTAAATNGQHQAYFPGDIYEGQIELVTPDGLQLFSQPVALSYFDGSNSVLIAELTNSIGQVLGANQVIYTNAFNGVAADRRAEYFHREIAVANSSGPIWQNVTNTSGTFTNKGGLVFPANSQTLVYDADGNLSFDGIWTYQWDGENRLIAMTMTNVSGIANSNQLQLQFSYDFMGRRVSKEVLSWNGSTFSPQSTNYFVYDGWNLIATFNPQSSILQSFMWGQDLSGTMTGAGGVGGLLIASISGTNCFATYDGNGNITALINAVDKSLAARYEYSPYGELIRSTGLLAHQNPFRFSTKYWDDESGLVYYGGRYYNSTLGKWIGRDPKDQDMNLTEFVENSPLNSVDDNGYSTFVINQFYPGEYNANDGRECYSYQQTSVVTAEIRNGLKGGEMSAYGFIAWNFMPGGDLDYGRLDNADQSIPNYQFDQEAMTGHQFANNLAGYAAGYATMTYGDIGFDSIMDVATHVDTMRDAVRDGSVCEGLESLAGIAAGESDVYNGMVLGTMDALDGDDGD